VYAYMDIYLMKGFKGLPGVVGLLKQLEVSVLLQPTIDARTM
jgi:hypothetical protein